MSALPLYRLQLYNDSKCRLSQALIERKAALFNAPFLRLQCFNDIYQYTVYPFFAFERIHCIFVRFIRIKRNAEFIRINLQVHIMLFISSLYSDAFYIVKPVYMYVSFLYSRGRQIFFQ